MIKFVRSFLVLSLIFAFSVIGASAQVDGGALEDGEEVGGRDLHGKALP